MTGPVPRPAGLLSHRAVARFDAAIDSAAAWGRGRRSTDRVLYALSQAANHSVLWHGINLADAALGGAALGPEHRRRAVRRSVVLAVEQTVVNGPVKSLFRRGRPGAVTDHPHQLRTPQTSSFPSGHASAGACAATLLSRDLGVAPLWWTLAAAVAWSRVHVGVHHGSDLIGGIVVGSALGHLGGLVWPPAPRSTDRTPVVRGTGTPDHRARRIPSGA